MVLLEERTTTLPLWKPGSPSKHSENTANSLPYRLVSAAIAGVHCTSAGALTVVVQALAQVGTSGVSVVGARRSVHAAQNACSSTIAALVEDVAVAIALTFGNAVTATNATLVSDVAVAIAVTLWDASATADTTLVEYVSVAVALTFRDAVTTTNATLVFNVAVAVARAFRNVNASIVDGGRHVVVASGAVRASSA